MNANNNNGDAAQQSRQFKCTGNCLNCLPAQRAYCSSQHAYSNMRVLDEVMKTLQQIKTDIQEMRDAIDDMQGYDDVYEVQDTKPIHAQEGDGAQE